MSQDNETCFKCGALCGYDEGKSTWMGKKKTFHDTAICAKCTLEIVRQFVEFFGIVPSYTEYGLELPWDEVVDILERIKVDVPGKKRYIETSDLDALRSIRKLGDPNDSKKEGCTH